MQTYLELFLLLYLPAMVANGTPVVAMRGRKGHPLDFGRLFADGRRVFGESKTFEGFFLGIASGVLVSAALGISLHSGYSISEIMVTGLASAFGAMLGDLTKSFFKRRLGLESGEPLPAADQVDFYLGANLLLILTPRAIKPTPLLFLVGIAVIPILHIVTNRIAYRLGLKKVPY